MHSNWIIVCHYVAATLSITCLAYKLLGGESSARIKTFICMWTACSLDGHEWQFDFSGVGWVGGDEDTCWSPTQKSFYMEIYLNSLLANHSRSEFHLRVHTIDTATMTWLFMVSDFLPIARFSSPSSGPWASSTIRFNIPFNWWAREAIETWNMRRRRSRKPDRCLREWFYRYERDGERLPVHSTLRQCSQTESCFIWTCWCWRSSRFGMEVTTLISRMDGIWATSHVM